MGIPSVRSHAPLSGMPTSELTTLLTFEIALFPSEPLSKDGIIWSSVASSSPYILVPSWALKDF